MRLVRNTAERDEIVREDWRAEIRDTVVLLERERGLFDPVDRMRRLVSSVTW
jgi:hypothetical protein